jgi:hypothetical protein
VTSKKNESGGIKWSPRTQNSSHDKKKESLNLIPSVILFYLEKKKESKFELIRTAFVCIAGGGRAGQRLRRENVPFLSFEIFLE